MFLTQFSVTQDLEDTSEEIEKTQKVIDESIKYMKELITSVGSAKSSYSIEDVKKECRNREYLCSYWASKEDCESSAYLMKNCCPSCKSFRFVPDRNVMKAIALYGAPQEAIDDEIFETYAVIKSALEHMEHMKKLLPSKVFERCRNTDKLCSYWAGMGECEENVTYMKTNCPVSCKLCDKNFESENLLKNFYV